MNNRGISEIKSIKSFHRGFAKGVRDLTSRVVQNFESAIQAVKQAEQQAAKEMEAAREAASVGIQAAAATSGSDRPDQKDVDKLVQQVKTAETAFQQSVS